MKLIQIKENLKKKKAFTLIEILVAVFILEIGLLGVAGFFGYALQFAQSARNQTMGANLASGLLEDKIAQNFDNLTVEIGSKDPYSTVTGNPFGNFQKKIDIAYIDGDLLASQTPNSTNQNMKKITVTIYWTEQTGEKSFQIVTIKAKHQ